MCWIRENLKTHYNIIIIAALQLLSESKLGKTVN